MYKIALKNVHEYLSLKGVVKENFDINFDKIKIQDGEELLEIIIPNRENLIDYHSRINDLIHTISTIENKQVEEIAENLLNIGYDLLKFRFKASSTTDGNIPLLGYTEIIKGIENIMTYGACSVILPKSQYTRPYEEAKELVKNCEVGQTEKGSFVITVRVPLGQDFLTIEPEEIGEEYLKNFGRRTIWQIISGINEIKSINLDDENSFRENYDEKLSKNICDSMSELLQSENGFDVDINAKLNTFVESEQIMPISAIIESNSDFRKFNLASSYLKKIPEEKNMAVEGLIIRLNDNPQQRNDERKLITLNDPKLKRNIYIHLSEKDYRKACSAHGDGKKIQITGLLNKKQAHWCLDNPTGFKIQTVE